MDNHKVIKSTIDNRYATLEIYTVNQKHPVLADLGSCHMTYTPSPLPSWSFNSIYFITEL